MDELKDWMINENGVMRKPTQAELQQRKKDIADAQKDAETQSAEIQERSAKRQAVLDKLGLTADELKDLFDGRE